MNVIQNIFTLPLLFMERLITEKLSAYSFGLYHTNIKFIESYAVVNQKFNDPKTFIFWHHGLGHLRSSMMQRIIQHSHGHPLKNQKILLPNEYSCATFSQGKLIVRPLFSKVTFVSPIFLERIHGIYVDLSIHHVDLSITLWC